jgi:hypothetical protein
MKAKAVANWVCGISIAVVTVSILSAIGEYQLESPETRHIKQMTADLNEKLDAIDKSKQEDAEYRAQHPEPPCAKQYTERLKSDAAKGIESNRLQVWKEVCGYDRYQY